MQGKALNTEIAFRSATGAATGGAREKSITKLLVTEEGCHIDRIAAIANLNGGIAPGQRRNRDESSPRGKGVAGCCTECGDDTRRANGSAVNSNSDGS